MQSENTITLPYKPSNEPLTEWVVQEHHTQICGLTKDEYIALELTKAWASTTGQRYYDEEDIVNRYMDILNEVKARKM